MGIYFNSFFFTKTVKLAEVQSLSHRNHKFPHLSCQLCTGFAKAFYCRCRFSWLIFTYLFPRFKHVEKASEAEAIDILLISDSLFRSQEIVERKKYVNIVDRVKENNGQVRIFSSLHVSGERMFRFLILSNHGENNLINFSKPTNRIASIDRHCCHTPVSDARA